MTPGTLFRQAAAVGLLAVLCVSTGTVRTSAAAVLPTGFDDQPLVSALDWPVGLGFLPDGRLITCELKSGRLRMIVNGELGGIDPIGVVDSLDASTEEEGLLSVAVDCRWPTKPYLYVLYTAADSTIHLSRLAATGDLSDGTSGNLAVVPGSRRDLIRDIVSRNDAHNGGTLRFGPDSMLYVSLGEDANACTATDTTKLNGVILRLDVRNVPDGPGAPNKALLVPADNPWAGNANLNRRLTFARGLRNPFRFHIDAPTGRLFVADVGWQTYEEVDIVDAGGLNFGWPHFEGTSPWLSDECGPPVPPGLVPPVYEYARSQWCPYPDPLTCAAAIIGGVVLRHVEHSTVSFPASYDGHYIFSDYYDGFIWQIRDSAGIWVRAPVAPGQPNANDWARGYQQVSEYVLGPDGAVYYALNAYDSQSGTGEIRRIIHYNGSNGVDTGPNAGLELSPVYPSPAHGGATLRFALPRAMEARLTIYDAMGRRVRQLVPPSSLEAGEHRVRWDGQDESGRSVPPGIYLARLAAGGRVLARRIPFVR
jgi:glucose/arabinose dehydrogenase